MPEIEIPEEFRGHTPGPWEVRSHAYSHGGSGRRGAHHWIEAVGPASIQLDSGLDPSAAPTARLMAAAPELLRQKLEAEAEVERLRDAPARMLAAMEGIRDRHRAEAKYWLAENDTSSALLPLLRGEHFDETIAAARSALESPEVPRAGD